MLSVIDTPLCLSFYMRRKKTVLNYRQACSQLLTSCVMAFTRLRSLSDFKFSNILNMCLLKKIGFANSFIGCVITGQRCIETIRQDFSLYQLCSHVFFSFFVGEGGWGLLLSIFFLQISFHSLFLFVFYLFLLNLFCDLSSFEPVCSVGDF